jgi:hypothetical protein
MAVTRDDFQVGQQWWFSPSEKRNSPRWITVASVGRKIVRFAGTQAYVDLMECNNNVVRLRTKDFGGLGVLFRTLTEFENHKESMQRKQRFFRIVSGFHFCASLTDEQITEAAKILGIDLEKSE